MVTHMKTTVELPDDLLREAQHIARAEGTTLRSVLEEGLRAVIARYRSSQRFTLRDVSVSGRGLNPELAEAGWTRIKEISYCDRL
jgi:metal-responsive CopG/Arc/MetJ family transcriptional regulator